MGETLFGRQARGGPGSRKRPRDDGLNAGDTASQATQQTSMSDLDGCLEGSDGQAIAGRGRVAGQLRRFGAPIRPFPPRHGNAVASRGKQPS